MNSRNYNFQNTWYTLYPWIHYCPELKKILCFTCFTAKSKGLFSESTKYEEAFTKNGYGSWKHGHDGLRRHAHSQQHKEAVNKLLSSNESPIIKQLSSTTLKKQVEARTALKSIFTSIIYLARQGLALRGADSDGGNFIELLKLRSADILELQTWLCRPKSYTSGEIQNEILQNVAYQISLNVKDIIQRAKFYSVIVDETSDISVHEQVSISVRIVTDEFDVEEMFLGLYETSSTTGETLSKVVKDSLLRYGLSPDNLRGQCYDGASNMSGEFRGVQARILAWQPKAIYVHCFNHSLNLALQDTVSQSPFFRDILNYVHEIGTILRGSPKRMAQFENIVGNPNSNYAKPRPLCPTRWTVREKAIVGVLDNYVALLELLEDLANSNDKVSSKAAGIRSQMEKGEFYLGLLMSKNLFHAGETLSKLLQDPKSTVSGGIEAATLTITRLLDQRSEEKFNELWGNMNDKLKEFSLEEPILPRFRKKPKRYDNNHAPLTFSTPKDRLWHIYQEGITLMCEEIGKRFDQPGLKMYEKLETVLLKTPSENALNIAEVCNFYEWDSESLTSELSVLRNWGTLDWSSTNSFVLGFKSLKKESRMLLPTLSDLIKHLLVIPCSSAGAERSFSRVRRVKSYLRSTMGQARLNHCCMINCYSDMVSELDLNSMLQTFVEMRNREATFGKFSS